MKKGINIWSFKKGMTVAECMAMAKDAGFDGIELSLDEEGEISLNSSEKDILRIKKMAEDTGIEIASLATGLYWTYPVTSSDPKIRQKSKDIVKKQLETAALLGTDGILVVPGMVAGLSPDSQVVQYDVAYERALEAFMQLKEEAEAIKVSICLENVWNKFLLSPLEMRDFIDKINSPYVGVYLDVGNVIYTGYPEHWIRILGKRIKKVHFKDFRRKVGTLEGFVDLLAGDVNFPEVMQAFKEVGYDDYVTAEMIPNYTHYTNQIIYNTSKSMDRILGR
ncbi:MAG: sugar phosphate isomerase/epimerase family protein [Caldicoprobacter oshimai]|uniref:Hexulose-6-phosphate isomerase n=1 Tax=Caldicoprobacter faecalis TaxID=937334 RepID=A0A1I5W143_9FIRM|nr:sugar phosphate isomerase/epimerase family protein [Caldicoprobacter faecalis]PZN11500.1 MAG: sugar phosphate isomerase/epimerase [Caldicoprobacter oshimai]SFQ12976.1 hexulose-6-phosphate isomerase [Caldicoprobacter faecalis]